MLTPEQRQKVVDEIVKSGNMFIDSGSWNEAKGNVSSATKILDAVVEKHGPAEAYVIIGMVTEALAEANKDKVLTNEITDEQYEEAVNTLVGIAQTTLGDDVTLKEYREGTAAARDFLDEMIFLYGSDVARRIVDDAHTRYDSLGV